MPTETSPNNLQEQAEFYDFDKAKDFALRLISRWHDKNDGMLKRAEENRKLRAAVADVQQMQANGKLRPNHTFLGVRLIDGNVVNSMPSHLMYLKQSRRLGIFLPSDTRLNVVAPDAITRLENEFARVLTYQGWEEDYIKLLDGSSLHGCDWVEVMLDESKPGHCAVNFVGVEKLLYDPNVTDIQSSRMVLRSYAVTLVDLNRMREAYEFDEAVFNEAKQKVQEKSGKECRLTPSENKFYIYQMFFKDDLGSVHTAWFMQDGTTWLRAPEPFYNGIQEQQTSISPAQAESGQMDMNTTITVVDKSQPLYPFFKKLYRITEEQTLYNAGGRAFLDQYKQEASSSVLSAFVNGCMDATCTMWAPSTGMGTEGVAPAQVSISIEHGKIWTQPMTAFNVPYPEATLLTALDKIGTLNQAETAQVNWAVNNKEDSRKTATEVQKSSEQQTVLSGTEVLMFSLTLSAIFNYAWQIIRSAAQSQRIPFLVNEAGQNDTRLLAQQFTIKPAGDIDFVERMQTVRKMQEDWPVFQNTPLRDTFLEDYIRVRYPESADKYVAMLKQGNLTLMLANTLQQTLQVTGGLMQAAQSGNADEVVAKYIPTVQQLAGQGIQLIQQVQAQQPAQA